MVSSKENGWKLSVDPLICDKLGFDKIVLR